MNPVDIGPANMPHIYVLDNGVQRLHTQFVASGTPSRVDDLADVRGTSFTRCTVDPASAGHGTGAAAIAAGSTHGILSTVRIKNVVVLSQGVNALGQATCIAGTPTHVAAGLEATYTDILNSGLTRPVINLSLGGTGPWPDVEFQIQNLLARNATIVAAAGNENVDARTIVPASIPGVLAVGASNEQDSRWLDAANRGSNFGNVVKLWAPGRNVVSADWAASGASAQAQWTGTSFAAPHVAGALALLMMQDKDLSSAQAQANLLSRATLYHLTQLGQGSRNALLYVGDDVPRLEQSFLRAVDPAKAERLNAVTPLGARIHIAGGDTHAAVVPHGPFSAGALERIDFSLGLRWSVDPSADPLSSGCKDVEVGAPISGPRVYYACMGNNAGVRQPVLLARDNAGAIVLGPTWLGPGSAVGGVAYEDADIFNPRVFVIAGRERTPPLTGTEVFVAAYHAESGALLASATLSAAGFSETHHAPVDVVFDGANVIAATYSDEPLLDKTFVWKLDAQSLNVVSFWQLPAPSVALEGIAATALAVQRAESGPGTIFNPAEVFLAAQVAVAVPGGGTTPWGYLYRLNSTRSGVHSNIEVVKDAWIDSLWSSEGDLYFGGSTTRTFPSGSLYGAPKAGTRDWDAFVGKTEGTVGRRRWLRSFNTSGTANNFGHGGYGASRAYIIGSDPVTHYVNDYVVY